MDLAAYLAMRKRVVDAGYQDDIDFYEKHFGTPPDADDFAWQYIWVVLNSGMKNQVAQLISDRITPAIKAGKSASTGFGHKGKCAAIDRFWSRRVELFAAFLALADDTERFIFTDPLVLRNRMGIAPWIGDITRYHLAKNLGVDCAKPDRHLDRIADHYGTNTHSLCATLAKASGDRVATVDVVLWRAANLGFIDTLQLRDAKAAGT